MRLKVLNKKFSICKVKSMLDIVLDGEFLFVGKTDEEISVVCESDHKPKDSIVCEDEWSGFRIEGELDFALVGILSKISSILAANEIGIFAVSTYNTDYILIKEHHLKKGMDALSENGYEII